MYVLVVFIVTTHIHVLGDSSDCLLVPDHHVKNNSKNHTNKKPLWSDRNVSDIYKPKFYDSIPSFKLGNVTFRRTSRFRNSTLHPTRTRLRSRKSYTTPLHRPSKYMVTSMLNKWERVRRNMPWRTTQTSEGHVRERPKYQPPKRITQDDRMVKTGPIMPSFSEHCDYYAQFCIRAYNTGIVCGRTVYLTYYTFRNYCMLDYVNCMERYEVWQIAHYGPCFNMSLRQLDYHLHYQYTDDYWMDGNVVNPIF